MTEQTRIDPISTETPAKAAAAVIEAAKDVAKTAEKTTEAMTATIEKAVAKPVEARRARRGTTGKAARKTVRKAGERVAAATRVEAIPAKTAKIKADRKVRAAQERIETMTKKTNSAFNFGAFENAAGFAPFQTLISDASERGQEFAKKSQKVAEELADLTRANVEAMVEAGKIAVEGTKSLGQDIIATGRDGVEQASDAIRSLAEAKSPTEYVQLQGEFARASFDRMVAETSKLTEAMVKLAGEAFQPLQNRASANAQRFNTFVA